MDRVQEALSSPPLLKAQCKHACTYFRTNRPIFGNQYICLINLINHSYTGFPPSSWCFRNKLNQTGTLSIIPCTVAHSALYSLISVPCFIATKIACALSCSWTVRNLLPERYWLCKHWHDSYSGHPHTASSSLVGTPATCTPVTSTYELSEELDSSSARLP